ncbi:uncharacterized protein FOMMEDRAFT_165424, partial [Fomitiporia mediterranea MF3/22]|uniref:uncharacterized protein n=1 Tax=Fomitiporia mediterranea (strain MF3/22) TaxID=694068 RepID=UPI000440999D
MSSEQNNDHLEVLYTTISLICQTLFYGVYAALIPLSTHFLLKRKTMSRANKFMFALTIFMFLLSTAFWASSVANLITTVNVFYASSPDHTPAAFLLYPLFNALILVNYIVTDSVVVWRAWVLCKNSSKGIFVVPFLLLACTSVSILVTIGIRVTMSINQ